MAAVARPVRARRHATLRAVVAALRLLHLRLRDLHPRVITALRHVAALLLLAALLFALLLLTLLLFALLLLLLHVALLLLAL